MPTAYLICGYIGVGKTTLAKELEKEIPAIRFTQDEWMSEIYGNYPAEETFDACYLKINRLINTVWPRCLALGVNVVLDLNFWTRASRDETIKIITNLNADYKLYYLRCDNDLAWTRIAARNQLLGNGIFVSQHIYDTSRHRFEELNSDENFIERKT
jgi:predicted kinase